jgi:crossover junction endodeoxyribonuclease RuvC
MKILAIDPGYDRIGIAIMTGDASRPTLLYSECFLTNRDDTHTERLASISKKIKALLVEHKPDKVAIESLFFSVNQKTALKVAEARGVIISQAGIAQVPTFELNPNSVKLAVTGYGASKKQNVILMIKKLVTIKKHIKFDDEYDAIAIGITALATK